MKHLTGLEIAEAVKGTIISGSPASYVNGFSIDSRTIKRDDFFIPLKGDRTDGHEFINDASSKGAKGSFVARGSSASIGEINPEFLLIEVEDTLSALQDVSAYYRELHSVKVVGITGSSGKTTTKDLIAAVLTEHTKILKTEGNLNNEIGLPLMLLKLRPEHEVAVLEMGMRGRGEIALLARLSRPEIAVITNVGEAHIELLGSKDAIAAAKAELVQALEPKDTAVLNGDDQYLRKIGTCFGGETVFFGLGKNVTLQAKDLRLVNQGSSFLLDLPMKGSCSFYLPLPGEHNVLNALAAIGVGCLLGVDVEKIQKGLARPDLTEMRFQVLETTKGWKIINDTYNANPSSMRASLKVLGEMKAAIKVAVLGDMLELGDISTKAHREIGSFAAGLVDYVLAVGDEACYLAEAAKVILGSERVYYFQGKKAAAEQLKRLNLPAETLILVKASRGIRLEDVVEELL